ncbi:MAG TPA: hypothetical protein VEJ67_07350 [Candidatus Cybelea sp.]|nr:hypothetical protein [Candidatus Cybelea sp.]
MFRLTFKGSILGIAVLAILSILYVVTWMTIEARKARALAPPGSGGVVGFDVVTMWHNMALFRDPFFWVVVIVFMALGSFVFRR